MNGLIRIIPTLFFTLILTACASTGLHRWVLEGGEVPSISFNPEEKDQTMQMDFAERQNEESQSRFLWEHLGRAVHRLEQEADPSALENLLHLMLQSSNPEWAYLPAKQLYLYDSEVYGPIFSQLATLRAGSSANSSDPYHRNNMEHHLIEDALYYRNLLGYAEADPEVQSHFASINQNFSVVPAQIYPWAVENLSSYYQNQLMESMVENSPWYSYYQLREHGMDRAAQELAQRAFHDESRNDMLMLYQSHFDPPQETWFTGSDESGSSTQRDGRLIIQNNSDAPYWGIWSEVPRVSPPGNWLEMSVILSGEAVLGTGGVRVELEDTGRFRLLWTSGPGNDNPIPLSPWEEIRDFAPGEPLYMGLHVSEERIWLRVGAHNVQALHGVPLGTNQIKIFAKAHSSIEIDWIKVYQLRQASDSFILPVEWGFQQFQAALAEQNTKMMANYLSDGLLRSNYLKRMLEDSLNQGGRFLWHEIQREMARRGDLGFFIETEGLINQGILTMELMDKDEIALEIRRQIGLLSDQGVENNDDPRELRILLANLRQNQGRDQQWDAVINHGYWPFNSTHQERQNQIYRLDNYAPFSDDAELLYEVLGVSVQSILRSYTHHYWQGDQETLDRMAQQAFPSRSQDVEFDYPFNIAERPYYIDFFNEHQDLWPTRSDHFDLSYDMGGYSLYLAEDLPDDSDYYYVYRDLNLEADDYSRRDMVEVEVQNESNPENGLDKIFAAYYGGVYVTIRNDREYKVSYWDFTLQTEVMVQDWQSYSGSEATGRTRIQIYNGTDKVLVRLNDNPQVELRGLSDFNTRMVFRVWRGSWFVVDNLTIRDYSPLIDPWIADLQQRAFELELEKAGEARCSWSLIYYLLRESYWSNKNSFNRQLQQLNQAIENVEDGEHRDWLMEFLPGNFLVALGSWEILGEMQDQLGYPSNHGLALAIQQRVDLEMISYGAGAHDDLLETLDSLYLGYNGYGGRWKEVFHDDDVPEYSLPDVHRWALYTDPLYREGRAWSDNSILFMGNLFDLEDYYVENGGLNIDL